MDATKEWNDNSDNDVIEVFKQYYDITNNNNDQVEYADLKQWIKNNNLQTTISFNKFIKELCKLNGVDRFKSNSKTYIRGVKSISNFNAF